MLAQPAAARALPCLNTGSFGCPAPRPSGPAVAPGDAIQTADERCSVGLTGAIGAAHYAVTAGHCYEAGATVSDAAGEEIGRFEAGAPDVLGKNGSLGFGLVRLNAGVGVSGAFGDSALATADTRPAVGEQVCKLGERTGQSCGTVVAVGRKHLYVDGLNVDHGDSGGVVYRMTPDGQAAFVGLVIGFFDGTTITDVEPASWLFPQLTRYAEDRHGRFGCYSR
jgi:hypothetical protein